MTADEQLSHKARCTVWRAIATGRMRPAPCEACGKRPKKVNGRQRIQTHHHKGYKREFWLDVAWLCPACHWVADERRREES